MPIVKQSFTIDYLLALRANQVRMTLIAEFTSE
jgi:hypothetical protein